MNTHHGIEKRKKQNHINFLSDLEDRMHIFLLSSPVKICPLSCAHIRLFSLGQDILTELKIWL